MCCPLAIPSCSLHPKPTFDAEEGGRQEDCDYLVIAQHVPHWQACVCLLTRALSLENDVLSLCQAQ